ncbi:K(+) efflux antiporter 2, chloroplastic [Auxenochlorella protothecoides]|uniref:K(+) efflux antiporter 2, chloroplastic n=1 Tax=Auxenochlorella protothecoides TaxID=3075 RepID=A0A087SSZ5_AUXPR|nr:K(+) efflux antiporter 2, chloroplastic [Auxenochlorella protothecoides]KFM28849.1 K(+) efflux antiporter 2, chloroplastic [Auxenochlorella protothecoides]
MPVIPALVAARRRVHLVRSQERDSAPARPQVPEQDAAVTALLAECGQDLEECDVEDSPELAPLKEALLRARRRRDEALGQREALEAEAQEPVAAAAAAEDQGEAPGPAGEDPLLEDLRSKVRELEHQAAAAAVAYESADRIAAAAMEAAEEAVRDEMECIAVFNEVESALAKTIEGLRQLDSTSDRQEEEWDRASHSSRASGGSLSVSEATEAALAAVAVSTSPDALAKVAAADAKLEDGVTPVTSLPTGASAGSAAVAAAAAAKKKRQAAKRPLSVYVMAAVFVAAAASAAQYLGMFAALAAGVQLAAERAGAALAVGRGLVAGLPWPHIHIHDSEKGLLETIWLLLSSVITVPLICKLPGGSAVLGFLAGGAIIGPYALGIIQNVSSVRHIAELGVVFLLFNIGLELSFDRLASMGKMVFGMGSAQDLAVVVLLMLIPLLTPSPENAAAGGVESLIRISKAIGVAAVKAVTCMATITVVGRWVLQPLYRRVAETRNPDIFAAMTLLVVLGTSLITQLAGLSLALGAFLAGLLLAETPFHLQIEADIAPYKGLLMGLFFMTVGMEISMGLLVAKLRTVLAAMVLLIGGKVAVMAGVGQVFGLSLVQSLRAGLLLSPGGEFAFVLFGEAVTKGILNAAMVQELYLVVALSMALTPFLAEWGARLGKILDKKDMKTMQPQEKEVEGLSDHVIIAGFGRVGRLIAEMLSEQLIPFVALDVDANRVAEGRALDLPVYFGDAGSPAVLHALRAEKAACAVITLDTPAANYRSVWALHKHFPLVKTFVRAHDVENGLQLEKAGATAVVPETLEPSLQLAAAVLTELDIPEGDVAEAIRDLRRTHLSELQDVARRSRTSLGYEVVGEQLRAVTGPELNGAGPLEPSLAAP